MNNLYVCLLGSAALAAARCQCACMLTLTTAEARRSRNVELQPTRTALRPEFCINMAQSMARFQAAAKAADPS